MPGFRFHPAVAGWFDATFPAPTPAQAGAWPAIAEGRDTLIVAPTGSGKTLAAFLAAIDALVREADAGDGLPDETRVVYVSPLKALSNDVNLNLTAPLAGIAARLDRDPGIRTAVRTGDTPQRERDAMRRRPPHILVTTPESLYILLGSESGRKMLAATREVIVDEIHAVAGSKRGAHLALTLERLDALCGRRPTRVGLSATQRPIATVARFLCGTGRGEACTLVDAGHARARDLGLEVAGTPLAPVMSGDAWSEVHARLATLIQAHRSTLVFVNTRRMAERLTRHLSDALGREAVAAHHGSMAREHRLDAEQRLKRGELKALVATASLELGIDIGDVDLVCQIGSPRAINAFLQRAGRAGHAVGGTPKARLFPTSRDDLVECAALLDAVRRGELDTLVVPEAPLDVLAQQIVAEVSAGERDEDGLYALATRAWPFRALSREDFDAVVRMLAEGFATRRGPRAAYLHRDAVNRVLRPRRNARTTVVTSGGAIPDTADYDVVLEPAAQRIGSVNEDFAVESLAGDVFQLGNRSYRILRIERGRVRVEDAQGQPPSIPFWIGEAPGRSDALSHAVSRLRAEVAARLDAGGTIAARAWLEREVGIGGAAAEQLVDYLLRARAALGLLPTQETLAMERFFDASGGMQLVIHSPWGSRMNRAWGLALRKRFCRSFNFELQAAATEDAIVLSLSTSHSFELGDVARYLHSGSVREVLVQAMLDAPMFATRWRWNATTALALPRFAGGARVAPQLQRMKSEDLLATVFPDQVACQENIVGEREVPDHPLVAQTVRDCLTEAMDIDRLEALLRRLESGEARIVARDLTQPSPLAAEVLGARPYAFLDDAPLEERRTQAVSERRFGDADTVGDFGALDATAIAAVRAEAWPDPRDRDEVHEALVGLGCVAAAEATAHGWDAHLATLATEGRAARLLPAAGNALWVAVERLPALAAVHPEAPVEPVPRVPEDYARETWTRERALVELLRARLTGLGPTPLAPLAETLGVDVDDALLALLALQSEGFVLRGRYSPDAAEEEWCERHLLARIHRYTVGRLRREVEPVAVRDFMRFLFDWQRLAPGARAAGPDALPGVLAQLEGFEAPAAAWEGELLPARLQGYEIGWLDAQCSAGRVAWTRLAPGMGAPASLKGSPLALLPRRMLARWIGLADTAAGEAREALSSRAQRVLDDLQRHGASFLDDIGDRSRLLRVELEDALAELVASGRITADGFNGLRALLVPPSRRAGAARRGRRASLFGLADAGRWAPLARGGSSDDDTVEHVARVLLRRYGVVCWRLLAREAAWLPPWRSLLRVYQRLEARGEIRGGRFVDGLVGEQFALPEAVGLLRSVRRRPHDGRILVVAASDPLNLAGILLPGPRVPAVLGNRVAWQDGVPVAARIAGETVRLDDAAPAVASWEPGSVSATSTEPAH
ncbi:DEAD/DEAH box helicase [Coralloluteibacterium thermophilus]|uniref:DEAD/DEAH box helicase n=1 Tax=Coralloluteibacterium thermophilum TaxID=2707049 RepID=A0ABV9NHZ4_9GAMM